MALGKPRDTRKEHFWRDWIGRWQHSGLSARDFCDRHHLPLPSFYAWRRTLRQRQASAGAFVPVRVLAEAPPGPAAGLEVVLAGGRRLHVSPGFDPATLRQLLAVLEEGLPC